MRERNSVLHWLISALIAGFVLQLMFGSRWFYNGQDSSQLFALSIAGLESGRAWTLLTHAFLHSPRFVLHGLGNGLALYFLGRELLPLLGGRRFLGLYAAATVVGGLGWAAVHWRLGRNDLLIGSTAAVYALIVVYACFFPRQEMGFWLFFVIPVTLRPRHIACALAGFDLLGLVSFEIPGHALPLGVAIAHAAHLGGMATGFVYFRFFHEARWPIGRREAAAEIPGPAQPATKSAGAAPVAAAGIGSRSDLRVEVDRILDKINSHGFAALTTDEKRVLDEAKDAITRR